MLVRLFGQGTSVTVTVTVTTISAGLLCMPNFVRACHVVKLFGQNGALKLASAGKPSRFILHAHLCACVCMSFAGQAVWLESTAGALHP